MSQISKEQFIDLVDNDEETWYDYFDNAVAEFSVYVNLKKKVKLTTRTEFRTGLTTYWKKDIENEEQIN